MITVEDARSRIPAARRLPKGEVASACQAAELAVAEPESTIEGIDAEGTYNAVVLDKPVALLVSVEDYAGDVGADMVGPQHMVAARNLVPPIVVEYVSIEDAEARYAKLLEAVAAELG